MPRVSQPRSPLTGEILTDETLALAAQEHGINLAETSVGRMFDGGAEKIAAAKQRRASLKKKAESILFNNKKYKVIDDMNDMLRIEAPDLGSDVWFQPDGPDSDAGQIIIDGESIDGTAIRQASLRKKAGITVGSKPFSAINAGSEGLVITGAGGDPQQWINGITEMLIDEGILKGLAPEDWISEAFTLSDNVEGKNGRTDLVLVFKDGDALDIGKMAMWRLKFGGASWLSDFVDNHAGDYKSSISGGSGVETEGSLKRKAEPKIETQDDEKKDGSYASRRRSKR